MEENIGSLFTLTARMEMDQEECQKWVKAYEADPRLRTVLETLRQSQRVDDYLLTPSGSDWDKEAWSSEDCRANVSATNDPTGMPR